MGVEVEMLVVVVVVVVVDGGGWCGVWLEMEVEQRLVSAASE